MSLKQPDFKTLSISAASLNIRGRFKCTLCRHPGKKHVFKSAWALLRHANHEHLARSTFKTEDRAASRDEILQMIFDQVERVLK